MLEVGLAVQSKLGSQVDVPALHPYHPLCNIVHHWGEMGEMGELRESQVRM